MDRRIGIAMAAVVVVAASVSAYMLGGEEENAVNRVNQMITVNSPVWSSNVKKADTKPEAPKYHYRPQDGWIGDIHPVYREGNWELYYLEAPRNSRANGVSLVEQKLIYSSDLLYWQSHTIEHADSEKTWWAIANLVSGDKMYSVQNNVKLGNAYDLSVTDDFKLWKPIENNPIVPARSVPGEPRDPFLFRNEAANEYWLIMAVKDLGNKPYTYTGKLYYTTSKDMLEWSELKELYDPGNIGVPEVPELFEMSGRYYLIASYGKGRVGTGHYRISDSPGGPWRTPVIDVIDGSEWMAPNSASNGDRRLSFGWIPTYRGNLDNGQWEWAGDMAFPREVYAGKDGRLYTKLPDEFLTLRSETLYSSAGESPIEYAIGGWNRNDEGTIATADRNYSEAWLPGQYKNFEFSTTITLSEESTNAGFLFRLGDSAFEGYEITVDLQHQTMALRLHLDRRTNIVSRPIEIQANEPMELRVIVDGDIVEAFLDDRYSMAGRALTGSSVHRTGFYADNGGVSFANTRIYEWK